MNTPVYSVYILRCADGSLYTGITTDVARRLTEHRSMSRGAKYLRGRGPFRLVLEREVGDRSAASKVEYQFKALMKSEKEDLIDHQESFEDFVSAVQRAQASGTGGG